MRPTTSHSLIDLTYEHSHEDLSGPGWKYKLMNGAYDRRVWYCSIQDPAKARASSAVTVESYGTVRAEYLFHYVDL